MLVEVVAVDGAGTFRLVGELDLSSIGDVTAALEQVHWRNAVIPTLRNVCLGQGRQGRAPPAPSDDGRRPPGGGGCKGVFSWAGYRTQPGGRVPMIFRRAVGQPGHAAVHRK
jgi:hypothetical protein